MEVLHTTRSVPISTGHLTHGSGTPSSLGLRWISLEGRFLGDIVCHHGERQK